MRTPSKKDPRRSKAGPPQPSDSIPRQIQIRKPRPGRKGGEPTPHAPTILAAMKSTNAADLLRQILLDPEDGLPDNAELTEIYMRYERGLPLTAR